MTQIKGRLCAVRHHPENRGKWKLCMVEQVVLQSGEQLKRGSGRPGLYRFDGGWRCFYCGRYLYERGPTLNALWFHFRLARDYWRIQCANGRDYINGVPVPGVPDPLPQVLQKDLSDPEPPPWFSVFVEMDEEGFKQYMRSKHIH